MQAATAAQERQDRRAGHRLTACARSSRWHGSFLGSIQAWQFWRPAGARCCLVHEVVSIAMEAVESHTNHKATMGKCSRQKLAWTHRQAGPVHGQAQHAQGPPRRNGAIAAVLSVEEALVCAGGANLPEHRARPQAGNDCLQALHYFVCCRLLPSPVLCPRRPCSAGAALGIWGVWDAAWAMTDSDAVRWHCPWHMRCFKAQIVAPGRCRLPGASEDAPRVLHHCANHGRICVFHAGKSR